LIPENVETLGANQAVIVRNKMVRHNLPQWLVDKRAFVLTIE
jgi:hypothetical protein